MSTDTLTTETATETTGTACDRCGHTVEGASAGTRYVVLCAICRLIAKARQRNERGV